MAISPRHHVLSLLRSREVSRIRFSFPASGRTLTLTARSFHRVAHAIERGNIAVGFDDTIADDAAAIYDTDPGGDLHGHISIRTQYLGRVADSDIMHECTHAVFDLDRTAIPALDDEAAAYVVGGLYSRMMGLPQSRYDSPIRNVARATVSRLLSAYQRGDVAVPDVEPAVWHLIRAIIPVRPAYINGPAASGGSYVHNG
jgi:hypothetical protein